MSNSKAYTNASIWKCRQTRTENYRAFMGVIHKGRRKNKSVSTNCIRTKVLLTTCGLRIWVIALRSVTLRGVEQSYWEKGKLRNSRKVQMCFTYMGDRNYGKFYIKGGGGQKYISDFYGAHFAAAFLFSKLLLKISDLTPHL